MVFIGRRRPVFYTEYHGQIGAHVREAVDGVGNNRYQRKDYNGSSLIKTTQYLGTVERVTENGHTLFKRYLAGAAIAERRWSFGRYELLLHERPLEILQLPATGVERTVAQVLESAIAQCRRESLVAENNPVTNP